MPPQLNRIINLLNIPVRILLVLAILAAIALAIYYWLFTTKELVNQNDSSATSSVASQVDIEDIISADLFGKTDEGPVVQEIKETALNLSLTGVLFNANDPKKSIAIIKQGNRKAEKHYVGDRIAGIAELTEILEDRVIITRNGQREWLAFDEPIPIFEKADETSFRFQHPNDGPYVTQAQIGSQETPELSAEEPAVTPTDLARWLHTTLTELSPNQNSKFESVEHDPTLAPKSPNTTAGFQIDDNWASRLGLKSGDVIKAINGTPIGNLTEGLPKINQRLENDTLELEIQRGEDTMKVSIKLN